MGCAVRRDGDALVIAMFEQWDSLVKDGANLRIPNVDVLDGVGAECRNNLSGLESGEGGHGQWLPKPRLPGACIGMDTLRPR